MPGIYRIVHGETLPDNRLPVEGERGPSLRFPLKITPPVFTLLVPGRSNRLLKLAAHDMVEADRAFIHKGRIIRYSATAPIAPSSVQTSALVRTRALGAPRVSPQLRPSGLVHTRAQGAPTVVPPPVIPPDPGPPPAPTPDVHTPRNLRYVRRRNRPERN